MELEVDAGEELVSIGLAPAPRPGPVPGEEENNPLRDFLARRLPPPRDVVDMGISPCSAPTASKDARLPTSYTRITAS